MCQLLPVSKPRWSSVTRLTADLQPNEFVPIRLRSRDRPACSETRSDQYHAGTAWPPVKDGTILPSSSSNTVNDFATSGPTWLSGSVNFLTKVNVIVRNVKEGKGTVGRLFNDGIALQQSERHDSRH